MDIEAAISANNNLVEHAQRKIVADEQLYNDFGNKYTYIVVNTDEHGHVSAMQRLAGG